VLVEYLRDLIRCESVEDSVALTADVAAGLGFEVERRETYLVARRGRGWVVLNGHLDVVDPGPGWTVDPFGAEVVDGRLYGRGSADAKGPFAALLFGAAGSGCDVTVVAATDEEVGGFSTAASIADGIVGEAVIVGEPTGLDLAPGCRGFTRFRMTVRGVHAHPGAGFEGVNAIAKAAQCVAALEQLQDDLDHRHPCALYDQLPRGHLINAATIRGGESLLAVPDLCVVEGSAGVIGDDTVELIRDEMTAALERVDAEVEIEWLEPAYEPAITPADHPFVACAAKAAARVLGREPRVLPLLGASDLRHYAGIPGFHLGPGSMRLAHGPDEFVEVEQALAAAEITAAILRDWTRPGRS
jgi:acetylornithine deacetylase/succinyl-diaminopimelate desuccinylase-like protein